MLYHAFFFFFCLHQPACFLITQTKLNACSPACFLITQTKLNLPAHYALSQVLLSSTLNHQAKCARHAFFFFCSHAHAPSHLNATRQIPCHTLSRVFLRHACHAFFVSFAFFILNSARILKKIFEN